MSEHETVLVLSISAALDIARWVYREWLAWDDYMDHAIQDSLDFAMPFPADLGNNKACFSTVFFIWVGEDPVYQWYVNTIMSTNNDLIITAYPSDNSAVSDCVD